jgi:hypothetical protein
MIHNDKEEEESIPHFGDDYGAFFEDTIMGEPEEDAEAHAAEDYLCQMLSQAEKSAKLKRNPEI